MNPNQAGSIAEAAFLHHAARAGVSVLLPAFEHGAYDAAIDLGHRLVRVQIKAGKLSASGDIITARLMRSRYSPGAGYVTSRYSADEVDAFVICCEETDGCYLVSHAETEGCGTSISALRHR